MSAFATSETFWTKSILVPAGQVAAVRGGSETGSSRIEVHGNLTVRSCCGFVTDDIKLIIFSVGFTASRNFGIVVGNTTFEWNTGQEQEYQIDLDNRWGQLCDEFGVCRPEPSHPSMHNKTVVLRVTERGNPTLWEYVSSPIVIGALAGVIVIGLIISAFVVKKGRGRTSKRQD